MNQFKKAKMMSKEAGHEIESVTGLQSAGISTQEIEENTIKEVVSDVEEKEVVQPITTVIIEEKNHDILNVEKEIKEVETPIIVKEKETVQEKEPVQIPIPHKIVETVIKEPETQAPEIAYVQPEYNKEERVRIVTKKAPNIFIQKEESKSVRKSLVLKPSSVKKAENYCTKNGGSFNELVQHLLDDFISEYGL